MKTLKLKSPGKVNLRLDVFNKRPDGYHEVRMLNSAISLYDDIQIDVIDRGVEILCANNPQVPLGEQNIVYAAAKEIMAYSNKNVGVRIHIDKKIPVASGMGGGSSNAASVIAGINQLLKINLSKEKLINIGLRFGSDIPFFLYGSAAIATGIGENLFKIKRLPHLPMVIVSPNLNVLTKNIYERYEPNGHGDISQEVELPREYSTKKAVIKMLHNDLESVTTKQHPVINDIKNLLLKTGALAAQMTGSGPTVFGIFADKEAAEKAQKRLVQKGEGQWQVFVAENI